jgi:hypothetical protein
MNEVVENTTKIGLRADMTIDDETVAIEGILGGDFFLQLSKPAVLGTPISFAYWLHEKYHVENLDVMLPDRYNAVTFKEEYKKYEAESDPQKRAAFEEVIEKHLEEKEIPPQLRGLVRSAFLAKLTITDLLIDIKEGDGESAGSRKMKFGLSVDFPDPIDLIPNVAVNRVSILVMNAPKNDFNFPARIALPPSEPLPVEPRRAKGSITFSDIPALNGTIKLNGVPIKLVKSKRNDGEVAALSDTLDDTLLKLARLLNAHGNAKIKLCRYSADLENRRLDITYRDVGFAGNDFTIEALDKSNGKASGPTLSGGFENTRPSQASGSITFVRLPVADDKITLGGVEWSFTTDDPSAGERKTKIGADIAATVTALAGALNGSDDAQIRRCSYSADGAVLTITHVTGGPEGNAFTIDAGKKATASASGLKLSGG